MNALPAIAILLASCAELPPCPHAKMDIYQRGDSVMYVFDHGNMVKMMAALQGLAEGKCRIEKEGEL